MRENIGLYRGKRKDNGEWVEGFYFRKPNPFSENGLPIAHCISDLPPFGVEVDPETVGECTNIPDENGKMIFEGDICKHRSEYSGKFIISVVTYTDGCFLAMADNNSGFNLSDKLEVIGNIHDNSELLQNT